MRIWAAALLVCSLSASAPAADLQQLVAEHFHVRVGLGDPGAEHVLTPLGSCVVLNHRDEVTLRIEAGQRLLIDCRDTVQEPVVWRIVVRDFSGRSKPSARALAARIGEAVNYPAQVLRLRGPGENDPEILRVALGGFESREEAEACLPSLATLTPEARLWRDERQRDVGRLRLRDESGAVLAEFQEQCTLVPVDPGTLIAVDWDGDSRTYRGRMICHAFGPGQVRLINHVHVEDYLMSVVAAEIGDAPAAALRAQAIVARSEALHKASDVHHRSVHIDLCDTTHCQVYRGAGAETEASRQAVRDTHGLVLMWGDEVCDAVYCHSSGGVTADCADVWRSDGVPYLTAQLDVDPPRPAPDLSSDGAVWAFLMDPPAVMSNPEAWDDFPSYERENFRWQLRYSAENFARQVGEHLGEIESVRVAERGQSGRVIRLVIEGSEGELELYKNTELREALPALRSTLFVIDEIRDDTGRLEQVRFVGGGWGHGVGLCQMGAHARALWGQSFREILEAYYPEAELRRVY